MKKVLVADDDLAILEVVSILLEEAGYDVVTVNDGTVLSLVHEVKPDLLLLDIWMAGVDGGELTRILKKDPLTMRIPIILISANRDTEKIAMQAGANAFISKPFDIDDFTAVVKKWIT